MSSCSCEDTRKCEFIQDRNNPDRYVCLPCGKVRETNQGWGIGFWEWLITFGIAVLLLI
jgi:hypothetical protein